MRKKIVSLLLVITGIAVMSSGCLFLDGDLEEDDPIEVIMPQNTPASEQEINIPVTEGSESDDIVIIDKDGNVIAGKESEDSTDSNTPVGDGSAHGYFTAYDLDGNEVTQAVFAESKLTVMNMWGTFCSPCLGEMPDLGELARSYDKSEVNFIGVVCDANESDTAEVKELVKDLGADYCHLCLNNDLNNWQFGEYQYVPTTVFVDSSGNILGYFVGAVSKDEWINQIESYR